MDIDDFKRVLTSFAEEPSNVDIRAGKAIIQIRDELIDVRISYSSDEFKKLLVSENDQIYPARTWLLNRIARLPQLADRIIASTASSGHVSTPSPFVIPSGNLVQDLTLGGDADEPLAIENTVDTLLDLATNHQPGATSVLYITSDAGEGKTTVINRVARLQAQLYKEKKVTSLVVPIPLNGRAFLTFDDAVIAVLVNKLRFNYFYFDAFIELIKLGAIVPAFDGYEEMLVEGSKGDAVSALGGLVQQLGSRGCVFMAARKAFFEYVSFKSQAKLLDAIGDHSASFSRMELHRWNHEKFLSYGKLRHSPDPQAIYETVATRLGPDHPLLTRAVLVRRLFDVTTEEFDRKQLAVLLGSNPHDYFFTFVDAIVQRESNEKWILRVAGELAEPLLLTEEHHELLAQISLEMWQSSVTALRHDILDVVVDMFVDGKQKRAAVIRQIKERIRQHSLLMIDSSKGLAIAFDHEDFQNFYLGEGIGRLLKNGPKSDLQSILSVSLISAATIEQSVQHLIRTSSDLSNAMNLLLSINRVETGFSFCKENCSALVIRLVECLNENRAEAVVLENMLFATDALAGRKLQKISFQHCQFQPTAISTGVFEEIDFKNCEFERLEIKTQSDILRGCKFAACRVDSLVVMPEEDCFYDPVRINILLRKMGAEIHLDEAVMSVVTPEDERVKLFGRFLRVFMRNTQVNEDVIKLRLGNSVAPKFLEEMLPVLLQHGVLTEVPWEGKGMQRRYKLTVPMSDLNSALESSGDSFDRFLEAIVSL